MSYRGGSTRVAAIADLHGFLPRIPPCELLLVGGDLCPLSGHGVEAQRAWLRGPFAAWLATIEAAAIVGVAGNHDFAAEADPQLMRSLPWIYLCDETADIAGLRVHGSPWTPTFGDWAFMRDDTELAQVWASIPPDIEVLLTHGPPLGHGDLTIHGVAAGSATLARRLPELTRLRLHVFGHIHEGGGYNTTGGGATLANVSHSDVDYRPVRPAAVFDL